MIEVQSDLIKTSTISSLDEIGKLFTDYGKVDVRAADGKITIFRDGSWLGEGSYKERKNGPGSVIEVKTWSWECDKS